MRVLLILCLGFALAAAAPPTSDEIDEILKMDPNPYLTDEAKWKALFDCFMDRGPCGEYQRIKDVLLPLLANKCEKCTPSQNAIFQARLQQFVEKYPKDLAEITTKLSSS